MSNCYVYGKWFGMSPTTQLMKGLGFNMVATPDEAEFIVFTGGADISPMLYGEVSLPYTSPNVQRDIEEIQLFYKYQLTRKFIGICRGAQLLNVLSGGRMFQHVDNHAIGANHECVDTVTNNKYRVNSLHHQMMRPHKVLSQVWGVTPRMSTKRLTTGEGDDEFPDVDIEAVFYPHTRAYCYQPHPEFSGVGSECADMFKEHLNRAFG